MIIFTLEFSEYHKIKQMNSRISTILIVMIYSTLTDGVAAADPTAVKPRTPYGDSEEARIMAILVANRGLQEFDRDNGPCTEILQEYVNIYMAVQ
ncbi:MAG: hypothetical protein LBJ92_03975 [Holosporales bacterium]|jgi:hypothetical protein|nr:hypothetical protein [Holosporales bacterium]